MAEAKKTKPYVVIPKEVLLEKFREYIRMNWRNLASLNPKIISFLQSTTRGTFTSVEFGYIGTEGAEAAIGVATEDSPDSILLNWHPSHRTAAITLTRLVTKYPALRVDKGYLRKFGVTLRTEGEVSFLVLDLKNSTVEPAPKKKQKPGTEQKKPPPTTVDNNAANTNNKAAAGEEVKPPAKPEEKEADE